MRPATQFGLASLFACILAAACGGGDDSSDDADAGSSEDSGGGDATFGDASADGGSPVDASRDGATGDGSITDSGEDAALDAGSTFYPDACEPAAALVDTSHPTTVVGDGTPASCTYAALKEAVRRGGIVTFACGAAPVTITLTGDLREQSGDPTQDGGADLTLDGDHLVTIDGAGASGLSVFNYGDAAAPAVTLQRITMQNGGFAAVAVGGALTVIDSAFVDTTAVSSIAAVSAGNSPSVRITGSTFMGNSVFRAPLYVTNDGGAPQSVFVTNSRFTMNNASSNTYAAGGLLVEGNNSVSLCGDVLDHNSASAGKGGAGRIVCDTASGCTTALPVVIDRCTFDSNSAAFFGGLDIEGKNLTLTNSTIVRNSISGNVGGGLYIATDKAVSILLENDTIASNTVTYNGFKQSAGIGLIGGGLMTAHLSHCTIARNNTAGLVVDTGSTATLDDSIVALNEGTFGLNCANYGSLSGNRNVVYPADTTYRCTTSESNVDPLLGAIGNNGGPTETIELDAGTPAESDAGCAGRDQRGLDRKKCTSGAVEGP